MSKPKTENRNSNSVIGSPPASSCGRGRRRSKARKGGSRRPGTKSLWLLPSGPDQVGDSAVRRLPRAHMVEARDRCKFCARPASSFTVQRLRGCVRSADAAHASCLLAIVAVCRGRAGTPRRRSLSPAMPGRRSSARWASRSRRATAADDTLADWFQQADRNHDGSAHRRRDDSRRRALLRDARRRPRRPDRSRRDRHYEMRIAPGIQLDVKLRGPVSPSRETRRGRARHEPAWRRRSRSDALPARSRARAIGLLDIPEPVAAADADFNRGVSLDEFRQAAAQRFRLLDITHSGPADARQLEDDAARAVRAAVKAAKPRHNGQSDEPQQCRIWPPGAPTVASPQRIQCIR